MIVEYWLVENTGFTHTSWFSSGKRYYNEKDAVQDAKKFKKLYPEYRHRVVHVKLEEIYLDI